MKITNSMGLPTPFVSMAQSDYERGPNEYRVTSLLKGTREAILERRHEADIERDVSDMIWLLFGTAVHSILERSTEAGDEIKETRLKVEIGNYTLSGQFDLYSESQKRITDYKTCSVWKVIFGDYSDWRQQILIYCWMMRKTGFEATEGEIVAIMKDHSKADAKRKPDYPKFPVKRIPFHFTEEDFAECEEWLAAKFEEIEFCETLPDAELPLCTPEERYNSGDKYAIMKNGRKTALRVLSDLEEAENWRAANGGDFIERRPGVDKKCADYCAACDYCAHYQQNVKGEQEDGRAE